MSEIVKSKKNNIIEFDKPKLKLLKEQICKGANDNEFELFKEVCLNTQLNPFKRQIFAVFR